MSLPFDEAHILPTLARQHDQVLELDPGQAEALLHALRFYLRWLVLASQHQGPLYPHQAQSIRPIHHVLVRLGRFWNTAWPRDRLRRPRPRRLRLEFDVALLLNGLLRSGELHAAEVAHRGPLSAVYLQLNQKAQNLTGFFQL